MEKEWEISKFMVGSNTDVGKKEIFYPETPLNMSCHEKLSKVSQDASNPIK